MRKLEQIVIVVLMVSCCARSLATLNGFNQIPTPDVQPTGLMTVSVQSQNTAIGNGLQLQFEVGVADRVGIEYIRGFEPGRDEVDAEYGILDHGPYLISVGAFDVGDRFRPQLFVQAGYQSDRWYLVAGTQRQESNFYGIFGVQYSFSARYQILFDYVSGSESFTAAGVNVNLTPTLSFNPGVFVTNSAPHRAFLYYWLGWNVKL